MITSARIGMTVENAVTGEPLEVDAEVAKSSIVVRVGDTVYAVSHRVLTMDQAAVFGRQLERLSS